MAKTQEFVNVSVRIRPSLSENANDPCVQIISEKPAVLLVPERSTTYNFDHLFTEDVNQESVYNETVKSLVEQVKNGYNCTVFTYGQTGTGKTYTMGTYSQLPNPSDSGLIPRTLNDFFDLNENIEVEIFVSFIEIYNEKVFDLLDNLTKAPLAVKGFKVCKFSRKKVCSSYEAKRFLDIGNRNRHTGETKQNAKSSRSHAIFTIHCTTRTQLAETTAKLNLVDLAGCESVKKTGTFGSSFHEGVNINKGLLCIGQVMTALSTNSVHIPYRQSVITTILQDSLNRNNFVSLIACISPNHEDLNETVQTLDFAYRVKKIKNRPEVNEFLTNYRKDHPALFATRFATPFKRTNQTPFKRSNETPHPSTVKRFKHAQPLSTVTEAYVNSTTVDSSKSLFSDSISSIASDTQQCLSPIIRKYMSSMEASLMAKLESVIINTINRPVRKSMRVMNKENTPKFSWDTIHSKVAKLVRAEIEECTIKQHRATSSPLEENNLKKARKILSYDSPELDAAPEENSIKRMLSFHSPELDEASIFKVPKSPIINKSRQILVPKRRSTRLSMKQNITIFEETAPLPDGNSCRRSTRIASRRNENNNTINDSTINEYTKVTNKKTKKARKANVDTPKKSHKNNVLNILNTGNQKNIEQLHTIGLKTAQQIVLFRELTGSFKTFDDLMLMPGWTKSRFERFMSNNLLNL